MLKAYTDEHGVFGLVQALRQRGMDVVRVQDRGRAQADDADLLDEALHDERIMLTNDTDFLIPAAQRTEHQQRFTPIFLGRPEKNLATTAPFDRAIDPQYHSRSESLRL